MPDSIIAVRASSWGSLFDCAHKWEGEHILGMRKASGLRAHLGTSVHAGTAAFDRAHLDGNDITPDDAAGAFIDTLHAPENPVDYHQDDLTVKEAERIGLTLTTRYCVEIAPNMEYASVERALEPLDIDAGNGQIVRLTGTMDRARVVRSSFGTVINDIKTGARVISDGQVSLKGRAPQLGAYQLMSEHTDGVVTAGAQITALQTSKAANIAVSPVFDAKKVMLGTETQKGLIEFAAEMFRSGLFPPNPLSPLCSPKYCARWNTCNFHE